MYNTILNRIRLALIGGLILTGTILGNANEPTSSPELCPATTIETTAPTEAPSTEAPEMTTEPQESEPTTETTAPETLPPAVTEPPTEPVTEETQPEPEPETEPETEPVILAAAQPTEETQPAAVNWRSIGTYTLTAYCSCQACCGQYAVNRPIDENGNPIVYTAIGAIAKAGTTIAVDPSMIPFGTSVQINGHTYIAQDTGGAVKGYHIDVYFDDHQAALNFGTQYAEVFVPA